MIRVFLVDDHELVREGLKAVLDREEDIEVIGEAGTAVEGLRQIIAMKPDVALLDLRLPDGNGLDVCSGVMGQTDDVACLILTSYSNDDVLLSAIRADASGFLLKRTDGGELVRSIRLVAGGGTLIDPTLTRQLLERVRSGGSRVQNGSALDNLSPQERRLLDHLSEGLTNRQIAGRMNLAEKTVKNYVSNVLRKLNMSSRTEAAVYFTNFRADQDRRSRLVDSAIMTA